MNLRIIIIVLFLPLSFLMGQNNFQISGTSEFYQNEKITIEPIQFNDKALPYSKVELYNSKIQIINHKFNVSGKTNNYVQPLEVIYHDEKINRFYVATFFIDPRSTIYNVTIPDLSTSNHIIVLNSKSQEEYNSILNRFDLEKIRIMPFEPGNLEKKYLFLKDYIHKNPNSFVALWIMISDYRYIGNNKVFASNLHFFGRQVKNSDLYKTFSLSIQNDLKLDEGKKFPEVILDNTKLPSIYGRKYTLVDFWFSYCKPCLELIPKYKQLYANYKDKGFEIIGFSTDRTQDIANWRKTVDKNNLSWQNVLDENGVEAKKYNINQFPTTFLLDAEGNIIKKNISPEELEQFLEENLKF